MSAAPTWDLEPLFPGGLQGPAFTQTILALEQEMEALVQQVDNLPPLSEDPDLWARLLLSLDPLTDRVSQVGAFAHCHACADSQNTEAQLAGSRTAALRNRGERAALPLSDGVARCAQEDFDGLMARPELEHMRPLMLQLRRDAALRLPLDQATLANELHQDGASAWGRLYTRTASRMKVQLSDGRRLSISQAFNLGSSADPTVRADALRGAEEAWEGQQDLCASTLSHITGARITLNDRRGVDELADVLAGSRMQRATLDAMLAAADGARPLVLRYFKAKAKLLGLQRLGWQDLSAPLPAAAGFSDWDQASGFVVKHLTSFHPELGGFAKDALDRRWIEAEDRPDKRPGAWCSSQPLTDSSRIFMTWGGSFRSTVTLAHELGHGYHNWVCRSLPRSQRRIPSTLAETASVFSESLVRDAALAAAKGPEQRLAMLDARLQAGATFLINLPVRFRFERELYTLRRQGELDPRVLSDTMLRLQREGYGDALSTWHPRFWASKLHFHMGGRSFYNYPYTFGYLFASLVYQQALEQGPSFHERYVALLQRTGWQDAEPLAQELLGIDLTDPEAWYAGVKPLEKDLASFLELAEA